MVLLRFDVSSNKSSTVDVLLIQAFMVFGSNLNDFLFLLLPHLMQLESIVRYDNAKMKGG